MGKGCYCRAHGDAQRSTYHERKSGKYFLAIFNRTTRLRAFAAKGKEMLSRGRLSTSDSCRGEEEKPVPERLACSILLLLFSLLAWPARFRFPMSSAHSPGDSVRVIAYLYAFIGPV